MDDTGKEKKTVKIDVSPEARAAAKVEAARQGRPMNELVSELILDGLVPLAWREKPEDK